MKTNNIKALILDMDGVFWKDTQWLVDPVEVFTRAKNAGIRVAMATNNATRTVDYYIDKYGSQGVELEEWQIMNSALATARQLQEYFPNGGEIFTIGEAGLENTLTDHGFSIGSKDPVAVVCGLDRQVTYQKLTTATHLINAGIPFIGTNPDKSFPTPEGPVPGAGSILAALQASTNREPEIIGKPEPAMYRHLLPSLGTIPEQTLVVGDRLETDILGAQTIGCKSALVLSGISTLAEAQNWVPAPDLVCDNLTAVLDELQA